MESNEVGNEVGDRVWYHREALGISRAELARRVDRHVNTVYVVEHNRGYPSIPLVMDIAKALDVPVGELVKGTSFYEELAPDIDKLAHFAEAVGQ
jgi:ribosome-binding protein aMBF1 (putative translation factor)